MSLQPQGEDMRKAVKWIAEERESSPDRPVSAIIQDACILFDLSPLDCEFLVRFVKQQG